MPGFVHCMKQRIGRRGTTLLFLTILDLVFAASLANPLPGTLRSPATRFIADIAPLWMWAGLWFAVGVLCLIGAFQRNDRWAFVAACALKILWGGIYVIGWALAGLDRGWLGGVVWLAFAGFVYMIAGWSEPPTTVKLRGRP